MVGDYDQPAEPEGSLFRKKFHTRLRGPRGSYTIVQDRQALATVPGLYQSVYRGCKVSSWSLMCTVDNPVVLSTEFIAERNVPTSGGVGGRSRQHPNPAPYRDAVSAFVWKDCSLRVGRAGQRGTFDMGFLRLFRLAVSNHLDMDRYYTDGFSNLREPVPRDTNTGQIDLEFAYAAVVDTWFNDNFIGGNLVSLEFNAVREGGYKMRLWIPHVFLEDVLVTGGVEDVPDFSVSGDVRYDPEGPDHAIELELVTEGSSY